MDVVGTAINAAVVAAVGLILAWLGKGRLEAQERRMDRMEERLDRRMESLQESVDAMRSDLPQVALALRIRGKTTNA